MTSPRNVPVLIALLIGIGLLAGCGSPISSSSGQPPAQTATPAVTAASPTSPAAAATTAAPAATSAPAQTSATAQAGATETETGYEPPNCGGSNCEQPGAAVTQNIQGNADAGAQVFTNSCQSCHGTEAKGGIANPGSEDGTVPSLNPLDPMFNTNDPTELKRELDLYVEHGSKTDGALSMPAWGDSKQLTPQQIADVIAYVASLNGVH